MKHWCECLIQLLKQIRTSGENKGESLANLCKCFIMFPNIANTFFEGMSAFCSVGCGFWVLIDSAGRHMGNTH